MDRFQEPTFKEEVASEYHLCEGYCNKKYLQEKLNEEGFCIQCAREKINEDNPLDDC